jgi:hypothetical protein
MTRGVLEQKKGRLWGWAGNSWRKVAVNFEVEVDFSDRDLE